MSKFVVSLIAGALLATPASLLANERVDSERSRSATATEVHWRTPPAMQLVKTQLRYAELPVQRMVDVQQANRSRDVRQPKATQIGIARTASSESVRKALPAPIWQRLPDGGQSTRFEVTSPLAMGLRVGLKLEGLDPRAELRFGGSELPLGDTLLVSGREALRSTLPDGTYWSPVTDGQTQVIEIYVPAGIDAGHLLVQAPQLSHLLTNTRRDFKLIEKIGESGTCNIDTACRVAELGPNFVHAKNAVAHMVYVKTGTSYICTGTLLNDTVPVTQEPWFFSAHHCISDQTVASTLNTHWNYEATACSSGISTARTIVTGGADYLFSDVNTDALLLKLRNPAPAIASFAGWDSAPMVPSSDVVAIHHPRGDAKKVSFGKHVPGRSDADNHAAAWLQGTTEGGSSGSGLFTVDAAGSYRLRGGLYGGYAECANAGNLNNTQNIDWYSRLDVVFPQIKQYLAPRPSRLNGSQPLLAPR